MMAGVFGNLDLGDMIGKIGQQFSRALGDNPFPTLGGGGGNPFDAIASKIPGNPFGAVSGANFGNPFGNVGAGVGATNPFRVDAGAGENPFGSFDVGSENPFGSFDTSRENPFGTFTSPGNPFNGMFEGRVADRATNVLPVAPGGGSTTPGQQGGSGKGATGIAGDAIWGRIDQYASLIDGAANEAGIDGDIFRAIMYNESNGIPTASNSIGASGLLQLMPSVWQGQGDPFDPATNLRLGANLMKEKVAGVKAAYAKNGVVADERTYARDLALAWAGHFDYATGRPNPNSSDVLFNQSADQLSTIFLSHYDALKAARGKQAPLVNGGTGSGINSIWGGQDASDTQGYGVVTSGIDQGIYGYGAAYGLPAGHTGIDVGLKRGAALYMPTGLTGTVETAGGTPYFRDEDYGDGGTPGKGELRIRLSNGDILIMGHTSAINVQAGQQVTGGMLVGAVGSANGDHLHLEVRRSNGNGGYTLVDPRQYFGR